MVNNLKYVLFLDCQINVDIRKTNVVFNEALLISPKILNSLTLLFV